MMKAYQQTGRWSDVMRVVRLLENRKALAPLHARAIRERALDALLLDAGCDASLVRSALDLLSDEERAVPSTAKRVAWAWLRVGEPRQARKLVESVLARNWDDALLEPYADCEDDLPAQLIQVERWIAQRPEGFELAWAKGRLLLSWEEFRRRRGRWSVRSRFDPPSESRSCWLRSRNSLGMGPVPNTIGSKPRRRPRLAACFQRFRAVARSAGPQY